MSRLTQYLFIQSAGPLVFFTIILSGIVWLSQSLEMLDLVINRGQSAVTFAQLSILLFPSLLTVVLPVALFCAILYTLHRLYNDSELVVMWSAGVSRWAIAWPIVFLALIVALLNLFLNLYLMPAGYRAMKDKVYEIRSDLAATLVREGAFTNPSKGLTVYIREVSRQGELLGLLVHDNREQSKPITYIAQTGALVRRDTQPLLLMRRGSIQAVTEIGRPPTRTSFDQYTFDLTEYATPKREARREYSERFLSELLNPDLNHKWDQQNFDRLKAEGHNRLASPLYNIAFALAGVVAAICGVFNRRGHSYRLVSAMAVVIVIRIAGFAAQSASGSNSALTILQYLLPLGTIVGCGVLLTDWTKTKSRLNKLFFGKNLQAAE